MDGELNNFISDLKPLVESYDFFNESLQAASKKDSGWGDLLVLLFATVNFGSQAKKTIEDLDRLVYVVKNPKPTGMLIPVEYFIQSHAPAFAVLKNQRFKN